MSQLFDNYIKHNTHIPDNISQFLYREPDYKDVIVIGATNEHVLNINPDKSDIYKLEIIYRQGTVIKLTKAFYMARFVPALLESGSLASTSWWLYPDNNAKLYVFSKEELEDQEFHLKDIPNHTIYRSILMYSLTAEDSQLFNDYDQDLIMQAKITYTDGCVDFTDAYKLRAIGTVTDTSGGEEYAEATLNDLVKLI